MRETHIKAAGLTDVGLKREGNEDAFLNDDDLGLYIVADGMGGHLAGEIASRIAVELINKSYRKWKEGDALNEALYGFPDSTLSSPGNYILSSIRLANRVIHEMAGHYEQYHGMGTTVALIAILPSLIVSANVGDSRIYLIRDGQLEKLSKDHTIVAEQMEMGIMTEEEAAHSPLKHVLTRNLGSSEDVEAEMCEFDPFNGDRFVLCSDGLTDLVSDEEILATVLREDNMKLLCKKFVDQALKRGGHDNITVVSVKLSGIRRKKFRPIKKIGGSLSDIFSKSK